MVTRVGGSRRKTRYKLAKDKAKKGKISIRDFLQSFKPGDKVELRAETGHQKGMYHPRFHGKVGKVTDSKKGRCYEVVIKEGSMAKRLIVHPVHLKKV
ncbi:50S ribosomal protein L21e [Candidatus Woesearchaeota archaeon]|nr:50S ribosomal protein L21e [Candidatus Woesearchaeota archaeon]